MARGARRSYTLGARNDGWPGVEVWQGLIGIAWVLCKAAWSGKMIQKMMVEGNLSVLNINDCLNMAPLISMLVYRRPCSEKYSAHTTDLVNLALITIFF